MNRIDRLIQDLEHPDFTRRADAAGHLHRHRHERVVAALARVLEHDPAEAARAMAAFSLSRMPGSGVVPALAPGVRDRSLHVRETVANGLARSDDERAVPLLCEALTFALERAVAIAENPAAWMSNGWASAGWGKRGESTGELEQHYHIRVVNLLSQARDGRAVPDLCAVVEDDCAIEVRYAAARALGRLAEHANAVQLTCAYEALNRAMTRRRLDPFFLRGPLRQVARASGIAEPDLPIPSQTPDAAAETLPIPAAASGDSVKR